jgi:hypothetical protein
LPERGVECISPSRLYRIRLIGNRGIIGAQAGKDAKVGFGAWAGIAIDGSERLLWRRERPFM